MIERKHLGRWLGLSMSLLGVACGPVDDGRDDADTIESGVVGTLTWVNPHAGATIDGTTTLSVKNAPAGTDRIAFWLDGVWVGADKSGPTYSFALDTSGYEEGVHQLAARARSAQNKTLAEAEITVHIGARGVPFGPSHMFGGPASLTESFTLTSESISANDIAERIDDARAAKVKLILNMTGGAHDNYLTNGVFDIAKWTAKMDTYDHATIKQLVAAAVADGTVIGNSVMDEPNVSGAGDGNTWGPKGTMTKKRVDAMCAYVKAMFPTLPVGVAHTHAAFEPDKSYQVCEFIIDQYSARFGSVGAFRDAGLALAERDGHSIMFSMNILNGGIQANNDGSWNCPSATTGGRGTYAPNCRMTPDQVYDFATTLGPHGCAMMMWRYDDAFMPKPANQQAFEDVAAVLAEAPSRSCARP